MQTFVSEAEPCPFSKYKDLFVRLLDDIFGEARDLVDKVCATPV